MLLTVQLVTLWQVGMRALDYLTEGTRPALDTAAAGTGRHRRDLGLEGGQLVEVGLDGRPDVQPHVVGVEPHQLRAALAGVSFELAEQPPAQTETAHRR